MCYLMCVSMRLKLFLGLENEDIWLSGTQPKAAYCKRKNRTIGLHLLFQVEWFTQILSCFGHRNTETSNG
jgi:hypothetical protein